VVHCSDSEDSLDFGVHDIRKWHLERGFSDIGYHYVIRRNGKVETGREESQVGAHVQGHNSHSIGICWVGRSRISQEQLDSLYAILRGLCHKYNLDPTEDVLGHCELDNKKTCPNLNMNLVRANLIFKGK
jgi:N-acetyl-anhydromuramyl-L-alanine amidase AmpD